MTGRVDGRGSADQITVFDSVGFAIGAEMQGGMVVRAYEDFWPHSAVGNKIPTPLVNLESREPASRNMRESPKSRVDVTMRVPPISVRCVRDLRPRTSARRTSSVTPQASIRPEALSTNNCPELPHYLAFACMRRLR
ncbi:hypothetical protein [Rhizobium leguminosarum]|uniref:hypothetical protein n=1 Tax=Rhizobium leguminosarum TaxID=384 RepID=UPI0039656BE6